jgi:hypothetical protein
MPNQYRTNNLIYPREMFIFSSSKIFTLGNKNNVLFLFAKGKFLSTVVLAVGLGQSFSNSNNVYSDQAIHLFQTFNNHIFISNIYFT